MAIALPVPARAAIGPEAGIVRVAGPMVIGPETTAHGVIAGMVIGAAMADVMVAVTVDDRARTVSRDKGGEPRDGMIELSRCIHRTQR